MIITIKKEADRAELVRILMANGYDLKISMKAIANRKTKQQIINVEDNKIENLLKNGTNYIEGLGGQAICPNCGKLYRVDNNPIDWGKVCEVKNEYNTQV